MFGGGVGGEIFEKDFDFEGGAVGVHYSAAVAAVRIEIVRQSNGARWPWLPWFYEIEEIEIPFRNKN